MPAYLLRDIDPDLWARFKARSAQEQIPMRLLLMLLVEAYAAGKVSISVSARKAPR